MKELQTFKGHKKEVTSVSFHPYHEDLFVSGSFDGIILFWLVGYDTPQSELRGHTSSVWSLAWHPVGHILCSGSNDYTTKFWCRNRPGDSLKDGLIPGVKSQETTSESKFFYYYLFFFKKKKS